MSAETEPKEFGPLQARGLLEAGWNQGSVFRPNEYIGLPAGSPAEALLVVCTQACSLVHYDLAKEPHVELAIARPIQRYLPKDGPASGRDVRRFHMPIAGQDFPAIEVDITSRFNVARDVLGNFEPDVQRAEEVHCRNFAGWIARYYSRIALPDNLVGRARNTLLGALEKFLKASSDGGRSKHHEYVHSIYIQWEPNSELPPEKEYQLDLMVLCDAGDVGDRMSARLVEFGLDPDRRVVKDGVSMFCEVRARDETLVTELDGWIRLTEWDYMTGLGEAAEIGL